MNLQVLHPDRDESLYREAWNWRETYPKSVQAWDMVQDFNSWIGMMRGRISIAAINGKMFALITLEPTARNVYEAHLDCERRPNMTDILWAILSIQKKMFEELGAEEIFMGIIRRNMGTLRLAQSIGFNPDGTTETRGRLTWVKLRQTRAEYVEQEKRRDQNNQYTVGHSIGSVRYHEHV